MAITVLGACMIATFCAIIAIAICAIVFAIVRSHHESMAHNQDEQDHDEPMSIRESPFTFVYDQTLGGYTLEQNRHSNPNPGGGLGNLGRMSASESMVTIHVSPSQPKIFGDEKHQDRSMKVVLTPPTPAKKDRTIPFTLNAAGRARKSSS